jgi:hypothetical protein
MSQASAQSTCAVIHPPWLHFVEVFRWVCVSSNGQPTPEQLELHITDIGQMSGLPERAYLREHITSLTRAIVDLDSQIKTMILQQAKAGLDVQEHYAVLISQAGNALNTKKSVLAQALAQNDSPADVDGRQLAFEEMMKDGLPAFWQRDSRSINQVLHRVMGKHHFVVRDGEIVRVR